MVGWNLKPRTPYSSISLRASRTPSLPLCGSMLTKGISTSRFSDADFQHLVIVVAAEAGLALGIDREDHGGDLLGAIIGRGFRHGRRMLVRRLEIVGHLRLEIVIAVVAMHAAGLFGMGVDVDRHDVLRYRAASVWAFRVSSALDFARFGKLIIQYNEIRKPPDSGGPQNAIAIRWRGFTVPRRDRPGFARSDFQARALAKWRGRRECRMPMHPQRPCKGSSTAVGTTGSTGSIRLSLRDGFTAYSALSLVTGLVCHHPCEMRCFSRS